MPARVTAPPPTPAPAAPAPTPAARENLELKIGRYWLNRVGILSLVLGTAFFLVYSFQYLGPFAKIALGYAVGATLLILGLRLERRTGLEWYGRGLIGGGWAVLYFTTYAMYHVPETKILSSALLDMGLLLVVAAGAVRHALTYRSPTLTMLAFLLGFLTTGISQVTTFTFLSSVILIGSLVVIAARMRWYGLLLYGMVGSYLTHLVAVQPHLALDNGFVWLVGSPARATFWLLGSFLSLYWLGFTLGVLAFREKEEVSRNALLITTVLNGLVYTLLLIPLLTLAYPGTDHVALLLIGGLSLVMSAVAERRGLAAVSSAHLLFGLTLVTLAIPQKLTHRTTALLWFAEIASLAWLGVLFHRWTYRVFALALGYIALVWVLPAEAWSTDRIGPSLSWRWAIGGTAILCYALAAVASRRLDPARYRWFWERESFHLHAAAGCMVLWLLTWTSSSLARVSLYWALEASAVILLGRLIQDRGLRIFGAFWLFWPITLVVASLWAGWVWALPTALTMVGALFGISLVCRRAPLGPSFDFERHLTSVYAVTGSFLLAGILWHDLARHWLSLAWALEGLALIVIGFRCSRSSSSRSSSWTWPPPKRSTASCPSPSRARSSSWHLLVTRGSRGRTPASGIPANRRPDPGHRFERRS